MPWFPFYYADYMGDEKVISLTPTGRSAYIELLCSSWPMGCSLPNVPEHLWKYTPLIADAVKFFLFFRNFPPLETFSKP